MQKYKQESKQFNSNRQKKLKINQLQHNNSTIPLCPYPVAWGDQLL